MPGSAAGLLIQAAAGMLHAWTAGEAARARGEGGVQHGQASVLDRGRGVAMHRVRSVQRHLGMPALVAGTGEEHAAEDAGALQRPKRTTPTGAGLTARLKVPTIGGATAK